MTNRTRFLLVVSTAMAMIHCSSAGEPANDESKPPSTAASLAAGPLIDPDQQIADARAAQARSHGIWAKAGTPGSKAASPMTNLGKYPKFTDSEPASPVEKTPSAAPDPNAADVRTVETLPDGFTRVTLYEPAPGVTPEMLANMLREQGKTGVELLRHEAKPAASLAPNDCQYGQAHTFTCNPVSFWTNNGYSDPQVRFNDHSGSIWPTDNAVYKWNQVAGIDSYYLWNRCPFQAGARCVDVYSGNYGVGFTGRIQNYFAPGQNGGAFNESGFYVQLNDYYVTSSSANNTVTHELGHVMGLGHNDWSGDVMYFQQNSRVDIGGENRTLVESVYSVYR